MIRLYNVTCMYALRSEHLVQDNLSMLSSPAGVPQLFVVLCVELRIHGLSPIHLSMLLLFYSTQSSAVLLVRAFACYWSYSPMTPINHNNDQHGTTTVWQNKGKHIIMVTISTLIGLKTHSTGNKSYLALETKCLKKAIHQFLWDLCFPTLVILQRSYL